MSSAASVGSDERLRLFIALLLPNDAVARLVGWQERELRGRDVRIVPPNNLHITLAFLGHRPSSEMSRIVSEMRAAAKAARQIVLIPEKYRETSRVGMIVLRDGTAASNAASIAYDVQERMEGLGIPLRERRPWKPHVTVLRFTGNPPRITPPLPDLDELRPSEAALMMSRLRPSGAEYEVLESADLGG